MVPTDEQIVTGKDIYMPFMKNKSVGVVPMGMFNKEGINVHVELIIPTKGLAQYDSFKIFMVVFPA
jgi:hypothetical protein